MNTIVKDLLNGDVDSLLINSTNKEILDENMDSFQSNTRVIAELSIDVIQKKEQEEEEKYTTELEDGTKINTSEEFNSTKTYQDLEISNIQFTERDDMTVLLADVVNKGTSAHAPEIVKITILGDNEEVITEIKPVIGDIEAGETVQLNASVTADVANAKDFRIEPAE